MEANPFQSERRLPGGATLTLSGEQSGQGAPLVLLHGLSATRRNVVQGSSALLRRGYRLIAYDARGHGASSPAPGYRYADLVEDLVAVLDELELERAALVGSSMGAATAMAFALEQPDRVPALVQITPAYTGAGVDGDYWERLAAAFEEGGVEAFVEATGAQELPERWRAAASAATAQRMERHEHPAAVTQALREVPASSAWSGLDALAAVQVPTLVVASRDEADRLHPLAVAEEYVRRLPRAELAVEEEGKSPLAWQGARLSGVIGDFLERVGYAPS